MNIINIIARWLLASVTLVPPIVSAASLSIAVTDKAGNAVPGVVAVAMPTQRAMPPPVDVPAVVMDQRDLQFVPNVLPVHTGTPVVFPNSDPVAHQVYSFSPAKRFADLRFGWRALAVTAGSHLHRPVDERRYRGSAHAERPRHVRRGVLVVVRLAEPCNGSTSRDGPLRSHGHLDYARPAVLQQREQNAKAWTLAYLFNLNDHWQFAAEALRNEGSLQQRAVVGVPVNVTEDQLQLAVRYTF